MPSIFARKTSLATLVALFVAGLVAAQDIPIKNWEVPRAGLSKSGSFLELPVPFAPISPPCRLYDSRTGPGPIPGSGTRDFDFVPGGVPGCAAIPDNVVALSLYFTVVAPQGPGFLFTYPTGDPPTSPTSVINYTGAFGEVRNNAAIVPVDPSTGSFTVGIGGAGTDLIIDVNGIFYNDLPSSHQFSIIARTAGGPAIHGVNLSTASGSHGVGGFATGGLVHGVEGRIGSTAFQGSSGVHGINDSQNGFTYGVLGEATPTTGEIASFGVRGHNANTSAYGVGVFGTHAGGGIGVQAHALHGEGVQGVAGIPGGLGGIGVHGVGWGTMNNGVRGMSVADGGVGVFFIGGLAGTGTKSFIEPHPTNPALAIKYVSLEGPEAGTYFRGRAKISGGLARIAVPETFRMVTADEGLTIQVTAMGEMATFAVTRLTLEEIVVKGSRNVEFCYTVNGVRRGYKDWNPFTSSEMAFRPSSPDDRLPENLSDDERSRLIQNGTYNPDGTLNLDTAKKLGWDKSWAKTQPAPVP